MNPRKSIQSHATHGLASIIGLAVATFAQTPATPKGESQPKDLRLATAMSNAATRELPSRAGRMVLGKDILSFRRHANGADATIVIDGQMVSVRLQPTDPRRRDIRWEVNGTDCTDPMRKLTDTITCFRGVAEGGNHDTVFALQCGDRLEVLALPNFKGPGKPKPAGGARMRHEDPNSSNSTTDAYPFVDLALEMDAEFFQRVDLGRRDLLQTAGVALFHTAILDFVFQREVGIRYRLSYGAIWTDVQRDPYYSFNTKDLVNGMQAFWNRNRRGVLRDSAHLLSGKIMDKLGATVQVNGGYPGHICHVGNAFSVSSPGRANKMFDVVYNLASNILHEQGHQWGSGHCSGPQCRLMCGAPSCFVQILEFENYTKGLIHKHLATRNCLTWVPTGRSSTDPDLIVDGFVLPPAFGRGLQHRVGVRIKNVGRSHARQTVRIGTWLTLDGNPYGGGDDIPMGGPGMANPLPGIGVDLAPGETQTYYFQTFPVPNLALIGQQIFVAHVDMGALPSASLREFDETNNLGRRSSQVKGQDALVTNISGPTSGVDHQRITVNVTIRNDSVNVLDIPVNLAIGGSWARTLARAVGPQQTRTVPMQIQLPGTNAQCNNPTRLSVVGCTNLQADTVRSNDCRSYAIAVVNPVFDLKIELVRTNSTANRGGSTSWTVRWTNVGRGTSPWVGMRTGISLTSDDPHHWCCNFGFNHCGPQIQTYNVPPLAHGQTHQRTFTHCLDRGMRVGTQYIKVGVNRSGGAFDHCHHGANFAVRSIQVR